MKQNKRCEVSQAVQRLAEALPVLLFLPSVSGEQDVLIISFSEEFLHEELSPDGNWSQKYPAGRMVCSPLTRRRAGCVGFFEMESER